MTFCWWYDFYKPSFRNQGQYFFLQLRFFNVKYTPKSSMNTVDYPASASEHHYFFEAFLYCFHSNKLTIAGTWGDFFTPSRNSFWTVGRFRFFPYNLCNLQALPPYWCSLMLLPINLLFLRTILTIPAPLPTTMHFTLFAKD